MNEVFWGTIREKAKDRKYDEKVLKRRTRREIKPTVTTKRERQGLFLFAV